VEQFSWEKSHMMSKQELKDEFRQTEGDPRVKGQIRARARQRLKKGLVKQVRASDLVLANPRTCRSPCAIAPKKEHGGDAKGYDDVALSIREIGRKRRSPSSKPPAGPRAGRARARGKTIPVDLYAAVAEVLAFVYRMRGRKVA